MPRANMLLRPLLRMDDHIRVWLTRPIVYLLLTVALLWTARYTCYTISCPLVHRGRPWEGAIMWKIYIYIILYICICVYFSLSFLFFFFFFFCHVLQFNWLPVTSISVLEVGATCHFWIGLCRFTCPGQLPIYSGIPPLPSTFAKFSLIMLG